MSVKTEMERISQNVANTYATLEALGCDMPDEQNSDNLATTAGTSKVVMFKEQTLTEAQQTQSRKNIGAASAKEVSQISKQITEHNVSEKAHNDIRLLIEGLTARLNALADSDDTTLDQMSEVVAYVKANKSLIDSITTSKVNVSDIIDNVVTSVSNKPLSAKQGVVLKGLIDAIVVPTKTSQLTNDSGFLTQHQSLSGYAKTTDHYTKTESDNKYQPKGDYLTSVPSEYVTETELSAKGYLTQHQDISGKANKSDAETWTFTLEDGSTVTKKVVLA